ncbi:MAG: hypothetical protein JW882_10365 [Deltaproteobacteria bacterium]|nr:hypothetical protein [Deltaproteobacteria bacterium]
MKIIICLKLITEPDVVEFDIKSEQLHDIYKVLDHIGYHLIEEALLLRKKLGGEVIGVSVAPEEGDEILKNALIYGIDRAMRIWRDDFQHADTWKSSLAIAEILREIGFDLVLCGTKSKDTGSGFMVSALAEHLRVPSATGIIGIEAVNDKKIVVHKKLMKGKRETYNLELPAVLGLEEGINEPGYVAPFSRTYRRGMGRKVELILPKLLKTEGNRLIKTLRFSQPSPRVKVGKDVSSLSIQDKLKMMRGELGREKEELFNGSPEDAARKIFNQLKETIK